MARRPPRTSSALTLVIASRAPDIPSGWPRAIAPPCGFTRSLSSAMPSCRRTASPCEAKASFSSMTSMSASVRPVFASSFWVAGAGPMPMMRGSTPAETTATTRARGVRPYFATAASEARSRAPAPSFTPEALPAVMVPPFRNGVFSFASCSRVVSARGCSSTDTVVVPPFTGTSIGAISRAKNPACCAAAARCCERHAKRS